MSWHYILLLNPRYISLVFQPVEWQAHLDQIITNLIIHSLPFGRWFDLFNIIDLVKWFTNRLFVQFIDIKRNNLFNQFVSLPTTHSPYGMGNLPADLGIEPTGVSWCSAPPSSVAGRD